jgi:exopolysaccharide biosynthesis predicted pyruvyltransferase EpsI
MTADDRAIAEAGLRDAATDSLEALLSAHRTERWLFVRPGGNWGDHLIYAGAEHLARKCGLSAWTSSDAEQFLAGSAPSARFVYVHGGGGYNTWGSGRPFKLLARAAQSDAELVVQGPQTLENASDAIRSRLADALAHRRARRIVFFARDPYSFDALRSFALGDCEIALDHDTAFHLDEHEILRLADVARVPEGRYDLTVYREDDESPPDRDGVAARGVVLDPAYVARSFAHWLRIHLYARSVMSNRLHSSIVAALAGKRVMLALGSYHKNRSIFEFSLKERGVQWVQGIRVQPRPWARLPKALRESYKVAMLCLWLQRVPLR